MKKNRKSPPMGGKYRLTTKGTVQWAEGRANVRQRAARKVPDEYDLVRILAHIEATSSSPESDRVKVLLSFRAGLRSHEIAELRWDDCLTAEGKIGECLFVSAIAHPALRSRLVPIHPELAKALSDLRERHGDASQVAFKG